MTRLWVCAGLALATLAVFWPVLGHDFVNFDDDEYVTANPHVRGGLDAESFRWAWTTAWVSNWHPLTWLSHLLDVELFGLDPGGHHLTSLVLHVANALLLFLVLERMTGRRWRAAAVAALFAVHPLHVESVAWVSERKDVLSTLFWLTTTWAYVRWTRSPGPWRYALVVLSFALGLCAKPMLVTLPFTLLLLDVWPLRRWSAPSLAGAWPGVREKIPLFLLSAASSAVTFLAQHTAGVVVALETHPWHLRLFNAVVAYAAYLGKAVWPSRLAAFYPHPGADLPLWKVIAAGALLAAVTAAMLRLAGRRPYLLVGWLWYLGTLVPVIGLVQVGAQAMADRYTYVPLIGVFLAVVWGIADLLDAASPRRAAARAVAVALALLIAVLAVVARGQVEHWRNSETLFAHAASVIPGNAVAHANLAQALAARGATDEAIEHFRRAVEIDPSLAVAHTNLGVTLARHGRVEEGLRHLERALELRPGSAETWNGLGVVLFDHDKLDAAILHFRRAVELKPWYAGAHRNLGVALGRRGLDEEALEHHREALRLGADPAEVRNNLGLSLRRLGRLDEAREELARAIALDPGHVRARVNLALLLEALGRHEEAEAGFREAIALQPDDADAHYSLSLLLIGRGRADEALDHLSRALEHDPDHVEALYNAGTLLAQRGRLADALERLSRAVELRPDHARAHYNLGAVLHRLGQPARAREEIELARRLGYDPAAPGDAAAGR